MLISILTLFPEVFAPIFNSSILKRAKSKNKLEIRLINIRDFAVDRHKSVDDKPFGGGVGMLLKIDILYRALKSAIIKNKTKQFKQNIILLDPAGSIFNQKKARLLANFDHLILISGHYEGFDYRINNFIDEKISIGRYILTGGEIPAMVIVDSVTRLLPGVLEKPDSYLNESFSHGLNLELPQYTRPRGFMGYKVPKELLSGDPKIIAGWKKTISSKK